MSSYNTNTNFTLYFDGTDFVINSVSYNSPLTITNTDITNQLIVDINITNNITNANDYLIVGSSNIKFEGNNKTINILLNDYGGFISNSNVLYTDIIIDNLNINSIGYTNLESSGFLCASPANNITATNCDVVGTISNNGGGIFGADTVNCIANNCSSKGNILISGGGIFGSNANNCSANNCSSSGIINFRAGGIFGMGCIQCSATSCMSKGIILTNAGGIFGENTNINTTGNKNCYATDCCSTGLIGNLNEYNAGGIYGYNANGGSDNTCKCFAIRCFSTNNIYGDENGYCGGIFSLSYNCEARLCYSLGNIGYGCGGIFGGDGILNGTAIYCYCRGNMDVNAGGIFGVGVRYCLATYCYTTGTINAVGAGGIYGYAALQSNAEFCYSLSLTPNVGGVYGEFATLCTATNNYVLTNNILGIDDTSCVVTSCFTESSGVWSDANASSVLLTTNWYSVGADTPYLLDKYVTNGGLAPSGYQKYYIIPEILSIDNNGTYNYKIIIGYYNAEDIPTSIESRFLYGYNITDIDINVDVNVTPPVPPVPSSSSSSSSSSDGKKKRKHRRHKRYKKCKSPPPNIYSLSYKCKDCNKKSNKYFS